MKYIPGLYIYYGLYIYIFYILLYIYYSLYIYIFYTLLYIYYESIYLAANLINVF